MLKTKLYTLPLLAGALLLSSAALKADIVYTVLVNTSSLNGTTGSVDFQFNSGVGTFQSATVDVTGFTGGGSYAGSQTIYGSGVSGGPIPSPILITNVAGQDNEVLDSYTFANSLAFTLDFSGPALTAPAGNNTAGSTFAFYVYSDAAGLNPALTADPNGISLEADLSPQGVLSTDIISPEVQITPEPPSLSLTAAALSLVSVLILRCRAVRG